MRPPGRPGAPPAPQQPAPQRPPGAGGHGGRGTPGPIPNPEVKPASAEGTAGATLWESRAPPAPGARCAGLGAGRREKSTWERGTREGPPLSFAGLLGAPRRQTGRRPPRGQAAFCVRGRPARIPYVDLPCRQCRRRPSFACRRPASRVLGGSGSWRGPPVRCPRRSMPWPLAPCLVEGAVPAHEALPAGFPSGCPISPGSRLACSRGRRTCIKA